MSQDSGRRSQDWPAPRPALADSVTLCWISGSGAAPRLCVCLSKACQKQKGNKSLQERALDLFWKCYEMVPNAPAWEDVKNPKIGPNRQTLVELRKRAQGKKGFVDADETAEGALADIQAVGVGPNKWLKERAFWLAMSATILLKNPEECATLCNEDVASLVEALYLLKQWTPVDVPAGCSFNMNNPEVETVKNVQDYLKKQASLLIDFQGRMGHDETTCAVLKPTEWLEWGQTWVRRAKQGPAIYRHGGDEISPKSHSVFVLDMRCKVNVVLLRQVLADENILKVCWAFSQTFFMNDLSSKVESAIQNVLDIKKAFCHDTKRKSVSECFGRLCPAVKTGADSLLFWKTQVGTVPQPLAVDSFKDAAQNVLAMEALISLGTPECLSYNSAWTNTSAMIDGDWKHLKSARGAKCGGSSIGRPEGEGRVEPSLLSSRADAQQSNSRQTCALKADETTQRYEAKPVSSEVLPCPCLHLNGHRFIIVSEQPDFVQGRCTTPESYNEIAKHHEHQDAVQNYRTFFEDVQNFLMNQGSLLIDFQGEMMGHAGEIYFAVIRPTVCSNLATMQRHGCELTGCLDGTLDSAAPTATYGIPISISECAGFILDMQSQVNVQVIKELLANPTICKVGWGCQEALENLIRQEHPSETHIQNWVDAQQMFPSDADNLVPLFRAMEDARNEMQQSGLKPKGIAQCCDWTEADWDRLQVLLHPPYWDQFHAYNERAVRRPFSQSFLKHGAASVLAMEVMVAQSQHSCRFDDKTFEVADHVIRAVRRDPYGFQSLQELRTQFLKHPSPDSNHARATAVKYFHHFAAVRVSDAGSECPEGSPEGSPEHRDLLKRLTWIDLKLPECDRPMRFQSDLIHELICKVVRNLQLTREDRLNFQSETNALFPHGVSICRFPTFHALKTWAAQLQDQSDYALKQDEETFFVEPPQSEPQGDCAQHLFLHLQFFHSANKIRTNGPGAWWGLSKDVWNNPGAETKKRLLQAIAWLFFGQSPSTEKSWTRFHSDWAVLACDIREMNVAPAARLKSLYFFDSQRMIFRRSSPDCLAPVGVNASSWHVPDRRSVETRSMNRIDTCGPVTLLFMCGSQAEPQIAKKITYESVRQQIQEQAQQWDLFSYIVEFPSIGGSCYARFKKRSWDVFLLSLKAPPPGDLSRFPTRAGEDHTFWQPAGRDSSLSMAHPSGGSSSERDVSANASSGSFRAREEEPQSLSVGFRRCGWESCQRAHAGDQCGDQCRVHQLLLDRLSQPYCA